MKWSEVLTGMAKPDRVRGLCVDALEALRDQGLAAQHATRQIHGDESLGEAKRHRRAAKASADLFRAAQNPVERASGAYQKSIEELNTKLSGPDIEVSDIAATEIRSKLSGIPQPARVASSGASKKAAI